MICVAPDYSQICQDPAQYNSFCDTHVTAAEAGAAEGESFEQSVASGEFCGLAAAAGFSADTLDTACCGGGNSVCASDDDATVDDTTGGDDTTVEDTTGDVPCFVFMSIQCLSTCTHADCDFMYAFYEFWLASHGSSDNR